MAKYTVELSGMLSAYASTLQVTENEDSVEVRDPMTGKKLLFSHSNFSYLKLNSPNWIIDNFGAEFIKGHVTHIPHNFTDDNEELNIAILDQFLKTFIRHFYSYEIGQENPMNWWVILEGFLAEHMPIWIMSYQKLMLENLAFITYESASTGNVKGNTKSKSHSDDDTVGAVADVPQNDLEWQFQSADPAETYAFNYATSVDGRKSENDTTAQTDNTQDSVSKTKARNYTIMQLINQLNQWSNGIYTELFQRAKSYGLFMLVN